MISLYMDHHVRRAIVSGLMQREIDVITAYQDDAHEFEDPALLDRAAELDRVLFTQDEDFLREGARRQEAGVYFVGIIYGHQRLSIANCIHDLELIAKAGVRQDFENQIVYLPF